MPAQTARGGRTRSTYWCHFVGQMKRKTKPTPAQATQILVYKVYADGFKGLDLGGSAAQSVVLMAIVILLTFVQFRYVERKVQY